MTNSTKKSLTQRILPPALVLIALAIILATMGYFMTIYRPDNYKPLSLSKLQQEASEAAGLKKAEQFHNSVYQHKQFSLSFEQNLLNRLLLHDQVTGYLSSQFDPWSDSFSWPQIQLADGIVRIMGQINYKGINAVLTAPFKLEITPNGLLQITRLPNKVGAITIPQFLIQGHLDKLAYQLREKLKDQKNSTNSELSDDLLKKLPQDLPEMLFNGRVAQKPILVIDSDTRVIITKIIIGQGVIEMAFAPLPANN